MLRRYSATVFYCAGINEVRKMTRKEEFLNDITVGVKELTKKITMEAGRLRSVANEKGSKHL